MDKVADLVRFQWVAYWRRLQRAGNLSRNNVGVLVLLGGLGILRYFQQVPLVSRQLSVGDTTRYQLLLSLIFLLWMLPVLGESRRSISCRALLHFPLTLRNLYCVRLASVFVSPLSWVVLGCSLVLIYPVAKASSPVAGITTLLLFSLLALFTSLTIADLLLNRSTRWLVFVFLVAICAVLTQLSKRESVIALGPWLPNRLTAAAAVSLTPVFSLAVLAGLSLVALLLSFWMFAAGLHSQQSSRSKRASVFPVIEMPGKFAGLVRKDFKYSFRLLDLYLALPIAILFDFYLISNSTPVPLAFWIIANVVLLPFISLAFNSFGLDNSLGLDRYALLPISAREILLSKNLSFLFVTLVLFSMVVPIAFWKLGGNASIQGVMIFILSALSYLSYGNWLSVNEPFKMQAYRFASGGSLVDTLMGVLVSSLPGALAVYWLYRDLDGALWKIPGLMVFYVGIYLLSLKWSARALERKWESLRVSLL